jgi:D-alanyl-lipoteichoic acid acyltransferase DltB (MBOAT superfamily)
LLFQSQVFILIFVPLMLGAYYLSARHVAVRELILIVGSAIFYGWWDARFLPLISGQVVLSWALARLAGRSPWLIPLGIVANLAVLALFKYADFAVETVEAAAGLQLPRSGLVLLIGISFYTFEIVSYLVDLRRATPRNTGSAGSCSMCCISRTSSPARSSATTN